ncbi:MAG: hypothetical protein ACR2P4_05175 [Gammaproteobacteria bacterium]
MKYWRVMLKHDGNNKAAECMRADYIGVDTAIFEDVSDYLSGGWGKFRRRFKPDYMKNRPDRESIGAGRSLASLWKIAKVMVPGDIVLSPDGDKFYASEIVSGGYYYAKEREKRGLFHCRPVKWSGKEIPRNDMPGTMPKGAGRATVVNVSKYAEDIKQLLGDTD